MKEKTGIIAGILTFLGFSALCVWHHASMPDPMLSSTPQLHSPSSSTPPGSPAAIPTSPSVIEPSPIPIPDPSTNQQEMAPPPQVQAEPSTIQEPPLQQQLLPPLRGKVIEFFADSDELTPKGREALDTLLIGLRNQPVQQIEIAGHTDNLGAEDYNRNLSQRRAEAVKRYFISQGIAEHSLIAQGYGSSLPIADNATAEGRQRNRRTEIIIHRIASRS